MDFVALDLSKESKLDKYMAYPRAESAPKHSRKLLVESRLGLILDIHLRAFKSPVAED